jgi:uncharacterized membrane protein YozB (DUF420 family)
MKKYLEQAGFLSPYGTFGADLSYLLAIGFTLLFMGGWYLAKQRKGQAHHTLTLIAMTAMLAYFVIYYLARELGAVAFEGKEGFGGGAFIYTWVFSPILSFHIWVVTVGIIMAVYMIILGYRVSIRSVDRSRTNRSAQAIHSSKKKGERVLVDGPPKLTLGRFSGYTLVISVFLAMALFMIRLLSRPPGIGLFIAWFSLCVGGGILLIALEGLARIFYPDGAKRHRTFGTFTMVLYLIALFTSTATYLMLYVFWPHISVK